MGKGEMAEGLLPAGHRGSDTGGLGATLDKLGSLQDTNGAKKARTITKTTTVTKARAKGAM